MLLKIASWIIIATIFEATLQISSIYSSLMFMRRMLLFSHFADLQIIIERSGTMFSKGGL